MQIIPRLRRSQFIRHNTVFFFGSLAVGAVNYLYYPIVGRMLSPLSFGEVQTLVSLFLQLNIFLAVFELIVTNIAANYSDISRRNLVIFELERIALGISVLLFLAACIFGIELQQFFHFTSSWPFAVLMLAIVINVPTTLRTAFVCGQHGFGRASVANLMVATAKIFLSVGLVMLGLGTVGAIWGVTGAQLLAFFYITYWARQLGLRRQPNRHLFSRIDFSLIAPELKYACIVLVSSLLITLQFSVDILVVKHYFSAHVAGLYAGIATAARIIFFLTGSIAQVMMPSVKLHFTPKQNRQLFMKSLGLQAAVGLPALAVFSLFPRVVIQLLMGSQYTQYAPLLPLLSMTIFVVALVNLIVAYYMALRRYAIALVVVGGALLTYTLMFISHATLAAVVSDLLIGSLSMILLVGAMTIIWPHAYKQRTVGATV